MPYRDVRQWARAVDRFVENDAESLVGGHTRPVVGKLSVKEC